MSPIRAIFAPPPAETHSAGTVLHDMFTCSILCLEHEREILLSHAKASSHICAHDGCNLTRIADPPSTPSCSSQHAACGSADQSAVSPRTWMQTNSNCVPSPVVSTLRPCAEILVLDVCFLIELAGCIHCSEGFVAFNSQLGFWCATND